MSKEMTFEEFSDVCNLAKEIEETFPEDYQTKITHLVDGKDGDIIKKMLAHLNVLLSNNSLNRRHLFSNEELNYFRFVMSYSREKFEEFETHRKKEEEKLFLSRKKALNKSQKEKYSGEFFDKSTGGDRNKSKYEETLLEDTLKYKKEYLSCPWWKFRKKNKLYHQWQDKLDSIIRSGIARKKIKQR